VDFLASQDADLLLLQEVDMNTRRTRRMDVAERVAQALRMNYVFGREFQELAEGSHDSPAYTGQATLSRWPLYSPRLIRFKRQSRFWLPRWWIPNAPMFQERLGGRISLVAEVRVAARRLVTYNLHLESRGEDQLRVSQLQEVLADTRTVPSGTPVIVGGDMNFDVSHPAAAGLIEHSGLRDVIGPHSVATTPRRRLFHAGRAIDRVLVRGPVRVEDITVHSLVEASDHYPLSLTLRFD
jgi:endonuclease/exonuclease/phosphatase family metal-dependent hydrolase